MVRVTWGSCWSLGLSTLIADDVNKCTCEGAKERISFVHGHASDSLAI
jgi:hypothetical protein